jgi:hypothetical protein
MIIPHIDDFIMQLLGMSESLYDGKRVVGWALYDICRPAGWPRSLYLLREYGYMDTTQGWAEMVGEHIGIPVMTNKEASSRGVLAKADRRWGDALARIPDYTGSMTNAMYDDMFPGGLAVCESTYRRTGRKVIR